MNLRLLTLLPFHSSLLSNRKSPKFEVFHLNNISLLFQIGDSFKSQGLHEDLEAQVSY
jgi:hypothetical protein